MRNSALKRASCWRSSNLSERNSTPYKINTAITDFSANSHGFVSVGILEFDFDVASHRQVGGSEETQPAFAEVDAAAHPRSWFRRND